MAGDRAQPVLGPLALRAGGDDEQPAREREPPGRPTGGPEEGREVLRETRGGHGPTLGPAQGVRERRQLAVDDVVEAVVPVDESEEELELVAESLLALVDRESLR